MKKIRFLFTKVLPVLLRYLLAYLLICVGYCKQYEKLWLISERGVDARDNGYFFYKYLRSKHPEIKCCYVINQQSADFPKVADIGETVERGSIKHYALLIRAECLLSSHIMGFTPEPEVFTILENRQLLRLPGKKVFLQHGIIINDIEGLKFPYVKPDIFICGALAEYIYIRDNYRHPENVVQYTGLARYDSLENESNGTQILLMPTWRKWLNDLSIEQFRQSAYYRAFSKLLSDGQVSDWLREKGLIIVFYPHFEMQKFIEAFAMLESDVVHIARFCDADVQTLLKQSSLLITDYSSVYFDFAFLGKPILFYQFDQNRFRADHYQHVLFDESCFGEISLAYETLKDKLFSSYDGNCFLNPHQEVQAQFFGEMQGDCCERIYNAIMRLLRESHD